MPTARNISFIVKNMPRGRENLRLQRRIYRDVSEELAFFRDDVSSEIRSYEKTYNREFRDSKLTPVERADINAAITRSNFTFVGDYHSFQRSQKAALRLLREIPHQNVVVGLECLHESVQPILDDSAGFSSLDDFARKTRFTNHWPFAFDQYRPIIELCLTRGYRILALNSGNGTSSLTDRDIQSAHILGHAYLQDSKPHYFALYGDLHLARKHLPHHLREVLASNGQKARFTTIFQNEPQVYWQLAQRGDLLDKQIIKLRERTFCLVTATPWVRLQSYIDWLEGGISDALGNDVDADFDTDSDERGMAKIMQFAEYLQGYFGLPKGGLPAVHLYDPDSVTELREALPERSVKFAKACIFNNQIYYSHHNSLMYVPGDSVNIFAEAAGQILLGENDAGYSPSHDPFEQFSLLALLHARSFFASLVINHKRKCEEVADLELRLKSLTGRLTEHQKFIKGAIRWALFQCEYLFQPEHVRTTTGKGGKKKKRSRFFQPNGRSYSFSMGYMAARLVGCILGERLFTAHSNGLLNDEAIRTFFTLTIHDEKHARRLLVDWSEAIARVKPVVRQKRDWY